MDILKLQLCSPGLFDYFNVVNNIVIRRKGQDRVILNIEKIDPNKIKITCTESFTSIIVFNL